jgi:hypothetical protein
LVLEELGDELVEGRGAAAGIGVGPEQTDVSERMRFEAVAAASNRRSSSGPVAPASLAALWACRIGAATCVSPSAIELRPAATRTRCLAASWSA